MTDIPGWPWRPDLCPADLHYGEYLISECPLNHDAPPKVLHVGTGLHHHIGLLLGAHGWGVDGLTVSFEEATAFKRLTNRPKGYDCYLGDIRDPLPDAFGRPMAYDSMSLFHLGEPPAADPWMLDEREVIERALTWSREVVFYTGSAAFDRLWPIIDALATEGKMEHTNSYKLLWIYRPTHG